MPLNRRGKKTNTTNVRNLQPPPDTTTGGEPGQTEEERREWKHTLRKEAEEKAGRPGATRKRRTRE